MTKNEMISSLDQYYKNIKAFREMKLLAGA